VIVGLRVRPLQATNLRDRYYWTELHNTYRIDDRSTSIVGLSAV